VHATDEPFLLGGDDAQRSKQRLKAKYSAKVRSYE